MIRNKKAQFYLMGAFFMVIILFAYLTIFNSYRTSNLSSAEFSKEEIEVECEHFLEYLIYNEYDDASKINYLEDFAEVYSKYTYAENVYFIFGIGGNMEVTAYRKKSDGAISIECGGTSESVDITSKTFTTQDVACVNNINVIIDDINNEFEINDGINLYFILDTGNGNEEKYIVSGNVIRNENEIQ